MVTLGNELMFTLRYLLNATNFSTWIYYVHDRNLGLHIFAKIVSKIRDLQ